ncbi:MAG TPA: DNA polymerase I [Ktedonobacterales bacterium]|nr:DNA polymerase I [Ktedonobacterales bacterium]
MDRALQASSPDTLPDSQSQPGDEIASAPTMALLDGHALFHRSFHAFPDEMSTTAGEPTNAIYGFTRMLLDVLRIIKPEYLALTFDRPTPTFRHKDYAPYKAHRPSLPEGMRPQFGRIRDVVAAFNIPIYELDGFEADDLLGTLARQAEEKRVRTVIATGDLDTLQLVDDWTRVTFARSPRKGEFEYFDRAAVEARFGVEPAQVVDYKGLVGDTSDNIPGVPGVGPKTASKLIGEYGTLENILDHLDELTGRTKLLLSENREQALHSKYLATIVTDAPVTLDLEGARALNYDPDDARRLLYELEFYSLADKLPRRLGDESAPTAVSRETKPPATSVAARPIQPAAGVPDTLDATAQLSLFAADELQALAEDGDVVAPPVARPPAPTLPLASAHNTNTMVIDSAEALDVLARALANADIFAFDLETDSASELQAQMVGLSFSLGAGEAYYVPVGHIADIEGNPPARQIPLADVLERLRTVFGDASVGKVGHNAKFDMLVLANHGIDVRGLRFDTMIAAYLLNPGRRGLGLKEQAFENLGIIMTPIDELIGKGRNQITMAQVPVRLAADYAGADADMTLRLMQTLGPTLDTRGLRQLFDEIEVPLVPVLTRMELTGMLVDKDFLRRMGSELEEQCSALVQDIYDSVGHQFNVNSTRQLGDVLFGELKLPHGRKTKTGYSVDAEVLDGLRGQHAAVDDLLEYRQLSKLKSTYVDGLLDLINPRDGRVHTSFSQTTAATGRLSSSNPNLQNIPIRTEVGRRIRRAFLADPGAYLLAADYSQIELRILAHVTREPALVAAFEAGEDIHAATASRLFKVPLAEVQPDQRRLAKTVNFAVLYGQSAFGLARTTGMGNAEAVEFIRNYEQTFPLVREYVQNTLHQARTQGYVQTLKGRRRYFPDMSGLPVVQRQAAEREAINMPIQGTNADMIKMAMIALQRQMEELGLRTRQILQVHDELVLEVPDNEVDLVAELVDGAMRNALVLSVPIQVEIKLGRNWYDVKPRD